tara:strand:- start:1077 stop:1292 length:216 start_codon:yes stop_codon:yes gene_type:complete
MSSFPQLNDDEKDLAKQLGLSHSDIHLLHLLLIRKDILNNTIKTSKEYIDTKKLEIKILDAKFKEILNKVT